MEATRATGHMAIEVLRTVLGGLEALLGRAGVTAWAEILREALDQRDAESMAEAYQRLSQGSAPGTFHDFSISLFNRHAITERQEPWVNELLTTCQAIALPAAHAILDRGASARMPASLEELADRRPWIAGEIPPRSRIVVYGMRCTTCDSRFILDSAAESGAAVLWSLSTVPSRIADGGLIGLVAAAFDPDGDPAIQAQLAQIRPAIDALGLPAIRLPYNRPDRGPVDRCPVCDAESWQPTMWLLERDPFHLVAMA